MSGWGKRQNPYPNQGYQYGREYNFSSDVNLSNSGGSFQFGAPPSQGYGGRPYGRGGGRRGGGGGFRARGGGGGGGGYVNRGGGGGGGGGGWGRGGGGYNQQPYGYNQRGYGNQQQYYRGNYPRRGPPGGGMGYRGNYRGGGQGYGGNYNQGYGGNYNQGYHQGQYNNKKFYAGGGGDPFYNQTMFEDPWRFLLPKPLEVKKDTKTTPNVVEKVNSGADGVAEAMEVTEGDTESRTDSTNKEEAMEGGTTGNGNDGSQHDKVEKGDSVAEESKNGQSAGNVDVGKSAAGSTKAVDENEKKAEEVSERLEGAGEVTAEQKTDTENDNPVEAENGSASVVKEKEADVPAVGEENENGAVADE